MNTEEIKAKAAELCAKHKEVVIVEFSTWAWPDGSLNTKWRVHVLGDGLRSVAKESKELEEAENEVNKALDPANRFKAVTDRIAALDAEAAALRASVGGAA